MTGKTDCWVIVQDAKEGNGVLFYADRTIQSKYWWTRSSDGALVWYDYQRAEDFCDKLKYNNPRVMHLFGALKINKDAAELRGLVTKTETKEG